MVNWFKSGDNNGNRQTNQASNSGAAQAGKPTDPPFPPLKNITVTPPSVPAEIPPSKDPGKSPRVIEGELTGFRCWSVLYGCLLTSLNHYVWPPNRPMVANQIPTLGNSNGIYAYNKDTKQQHGGWPGLNVSMVNGTVDLWGEVIECPNGYRAQFARAASIFSTGSAEVVQMIRHFYLGSPAPGPLNPIQTKIFRVFNEETFPNVPAFACWAVGGFLRLPDNVIIPLNQIAKVSLGVSGYSLSQNADLVPIFSGGGHQGFFDFPKIPTIIFQMQQQTIINTNNQVQTYSSSTNYNYTYVPTYQYFDPDETAMDTFLASLGGNSNYDFRQHLTKSLR